MISNVKFFVGYVFLAIAVLLNVQSVSAFDLPLIATNTEDLGRGVSRTMKSIATSTAEKPNKVRILFYGQSIVAQSWSHAVIRRLREQYPHAIIEYENRAIGGFQADRLSRTAINDMYPYYPDLVIFHDYMGYSENKDYKDQFEEMIAALRRNTTAEILLTTHHSSHQGNKWVKEKYDQESQIIRNIAKKYDCELVDIRKEWLNFLADNKLDVNSLLNDIIHLNDKGSKLMEELVYRHLSYNEAHITPHEKWIQTISVNKIISTPYNIKFEGNRIDLIAGEDGGTEVGIYIDDELPSAHRGAYVISRASTQPGKGKWYPAIMHISSNSMPVAEDWTLIITSISNECRERDSGTECLKHKFNVVGSKTGVDGAGESDKKFVSNTGRVVIESNDFLFGDMAEVGDKVTWSVRPLVSDTYIPSNKQSTVVQLLNNGVHTLEIKPDGEFKLKDIIIYQPPLK